MTASRRQEPFRYQFTTPESCLFQISEINGKVIESRHARADLIDIHKSGCKLAAQLDLRVEINHVKLMIDFPFSEEGPLLVSGDVRWQLQEQDRYLYGVQFSADAELKERIKAELRKLAGSKKIHAV
ncbi:PilZ domain-containing protein [Paenibacillus tarimensis]|uniref:PilZ domain-containing protein n=1 Tax=Paenibacillus tarimensis TaxID=416012 RepID=UPI001F35E291|nr:PilZ domain-containing protein [Paenibacillus tarimensis]MCF2944748.1 PilZ domain-containing protein [Paenibacillus tarimensis]